MKRICLFFFLFLFLSFSFWIFFFKSKYPSLLARDLGLFLLTRKGLVFALSWLMEGAFCVSLSDPAPSCTDWVLRTPSYLGETGINLGLWSHRSRGREVTMVTNGHVIHMMGHATQALRVRVSQEVHANQGLKRSSLLSGEFKIGGQGREHSREKDSGRKVRLGQSRSSQGSLNPGGRGRIYSLPRLASPQVT